MCTVSFTACHKMSVTSSEDLIPQSNRSLCIRDGDHRRLISANRTYPYWKRDNPKRVAILIISLFLRFVFRTEMDEKVIMKF